MNPFLNPIFAHFNVADTFCDEIVGSVDARLVVVIHFCGYYGIWKWLTCLGEIVNKVTNVDRKLGAFAGSIDFCFTGA